MDRHTLPVAPIYLLFFFVYKKIKIKEGVDAKKQTCGKKTTTRGNSPKTRGKTTTTRGIIPLKNQRLTQQYSKIHGLFQGCIPLGEKRRSAPLALLCAAEGQAKGAARINVLGVRGKAARKWRRANIRRGAGNRQRKGPPKRAWQISTLVGGLLACSEDCPPIQLAAPCAMGAPIRFKTVLDHGETWPLESASSAPSAFHEALDTIRLASSIYS